MDVEHHFIIVFSLIWNKALSFRGGRGGVMVDFDTHTSGQRRSMPDYSMARSSVQEASHGRWTRE